MFLKLEMRVSAVRVLNLLVQIPVVMATAGLLSSVVPLLTLLSIW